MHESRREQQEGSLCKILCGRTFYAGFRVGTAIPLFSILAWVSKIISFYFWTLSGVLFCFFILKIVLVDFRYWIHCGRGYLAHFPLLFDSDSSLGKHFSTSFRLLSPVVTFFQTLKIGWVGFWYWISCGSSCLAQFWLFFDSVSSFGFFFFFDIFRLFILKIYAYGISWN